MDGFTAAVAKVAGSIVRVEGGHRRPRSGVVWTSDRVVTSADGLDDGAPVNVGGQAARVLGVDDGLDLAVLEVAGATPAARGPLPATGAFVVAVGRPGERVRAALGLVGDVGGPWRTPRGGKVDAWVDVDGSLPRGFSGGALVDADGRVIGVNTHGLVRGGATIPAETVDRLVARVAAGAPGRGWLGVAVWPARTPSGQGLVILSVEPGGPADQAGWLVGDVLLGLGDAPISQPPELVAWLADGRAGATVTARMWRAGQPREATITVGRR